MEKIIFKKLQEAFEPELLEVVNNSHLHSRHFAVENLQHHNQTHFLVKISAKSFANKPKISIHRQINNLLKDEFKNGLHALEIKVI
ncbi:MAG: BolA family protein [Rickettsiales bacterium]